MASLANNKAKGRMWENAVAEWLGSRLGFNVERRRLMGTADRGDLAGLPHLVVECKNEQAWNVTKWLEETNQEVRNDIAVTKDTHTLGVVFKRLKGKPDVADSVVIMDPYTFLLLYSRWIATN